MPCPGHGVNSAFFSRVRPDFIPMIVRLRISCRQFCISRGPGCLPRPTTRRPQKVALWGGREFMTLTLASLVAGLETMPPLIFTG
jgi:hypothetical protein